ncbi:MAG: S8 family serine peptidase, partial [Anaerolineales bacterium]|nr:S8 family serine peptidase [Anaerolineales bacterium]
MKKHSKSLKAFTTIALFSVLVVMLFVVASSSVGATAASDAAVANNTVNDELNETAVYIIQLADSPVASYRGGVDGYAATSPAANGESDLRKSESTLAYAGYLEGVQSAFAQTLVETLDRPVVVKDTFQYAFNGLAVEMTAREASVVAKLDGVTLVQREQLEEVLTDVGPAWIGADSVWDGSASGVATKGEGIVVAILDTGINSTHPSFADIGGDGYDHTNPLGSGVYLGVCDPTNPDYQPAFDCNDKLIGVHDFIDGDGNDPNSPEDGDGHGSHTASTVAGNVVTATLYAPTTELTRTISGVAPHANIIAYDVCRNGESSQGGGCPGAALLAAAEQVVVDHMDLLDAGHPTGIATINYSISGGNNPYYDAVELAFLAATDAGVFVSASAGNSGPTAGTVAHLSPWVGTVAASTHNRALLNNLTDMTSDGASLADITGKSFSAGYGPAPIVYAGDYPNANDPGGDPGQCMQPYPAGTFDGEIVICDRGTIARVDKGANVLAGGAGGLVLANAAANGDSLNGDAHYLPAVHITYDDGVVLKAWVDANTNTVATISGTIVDLSASNGDIMASFSSRGPAGALDVLKPDITAPGVDIWAAISNDGDAIPDYGFLSGTSMSSPHNAGAVALMTAVHPDWSPQQIKSAMMSTAVNTGLYKEDGATPADPFDLGAGRVDLSMASQAALVLDETTANFTAANPVTGGDPTALNIPSMSNNECEGSCTWTRTVQSTAAYTTTWNATLSGAADIDWSVTPETFTLVPGATQTLTVTAEVGEAISGEWYFGELMLTYDAPIVPTSYDIYLPIIKQATGSLQAPAQSNAPVQVQAIPDAHFPIAVKPYAPPVIVVDPTSLSSSLDAGTTETQPITVTNEGGSDLTWSVFEGIFAPELVDWSDNFDSYATGSQIAGQGGWEGWGGDPGAGAIVTDTVSLSSPNSVDIAGPSDLVHQYSATTGWWTYTANVYVPSDFSGNSYFILLNTYGSDNNWSVQANFDSASGLLVNDGASGGTTPYLTDQWVEIRVEIDLLNDTQEFYYNNALLYSGTWSGEVSGGGALSIAAI